MKVRRTIELTDADQENIAILRKSNPAYTSDIDPIRHALAQSVNALERINPTAVRKIRREIAKQQQEETTNANA